jgi:hypothetical protein
LINLYFTQLAANGLFGDICDRVLRRMFGPIFEEATEAGSNMRLEVTLGWK